MRSRRSRNVFEAEEPDQKGQSFTQDLQQSLLHFTDPYAQSIAINKFEDLYRQKNLLTRTIEDQHEQLLLDRDSAVKARQRIAQLDELTQRSRRHASQMRVQLDKINEVHTMSKILMMERLIRLKKEQEELEQKRKLNQKIRMDRMESKSYRQDFQRSRISKTIELANTSSGAAEHLIRLSMHQTLQANRMRADIVKSEHQRLRSRQQRHEVIVNQTQEFKKERALSNYREKAQRLQEQLFSKEKHLAELKGGFQTEGLRFVEKESNDLTKPPSLFTTEIA